MTADLAIAEPAPVIERTQFKPAVLKSANNPYQQFLPSRRQGDDYYGHFESGSLAREFYFNGTRIPIRAADDGEEIRDLLTPSYPEIATATLTGRRIPATRFATLQPRHRLEGVSRARREMTREELAACSWPKRRGSSAANLILRGIQCKIMRPIERHRRSRSTLCRDRQDSAAGATRTAFATWRNDRSLDRASFAFIGESTTIHAQSRTTLQLCARWCARNWATQDLSRLAAVRFDLPNPP